MSGAAPLLVPALVQERLKHLSNGAAPCPPLPVWRKRHSACECAALLLLLLAHCDSEAPLGNRARSSSIASVAWTHVRALAFDAERPRVAFAVAPCDDRRRGQRPFETRTRLARGRLSQDRAQARLVRVERARRSLTGRLSMSVSAPVAVMTEKG